MPSYIPRKCSATNRIIGSKDRGSVQFSIAHVDEDGVYNKEITIVAFSGRCRKSGQADQALNRIAAQKGLMRDLDSFPSELKFRDTGKRHYHKH